MNGLSRRDYIDAFLLSRVDEHILYDLCTKGPLLTVFMEQRKQAEMTRVRIALVSNAG